MGSFYRGNLSHYIPLDTDIWSYVDSLNDPVNDVEDRLGKSQENVNIIKKLVQTWLGHPLFERKDGNRKALLNMDEHANARKVKQYKEIEEMSVKVTEIVQLNKNLLTENTPDQKQPWDNYLQFLENIVLDGLIKTVAVSYVCTSFFSVLNPGFHK